MIPDFGMARKYMIYAFSEFLFKILFIHLVLDVTIGMGMIA